MPDSTTEPDVGFLCPRCHGPVTHAAEAYHCAACDRAYPVVCGIADFRLFPDPYINLDEDRDKARHLFERAATCSFRELVEHYFRITPEVPEQLAHNYVDWICSQAAPRRAESMVRTLSERGSPSARARPVLEVGAGSGPFVVPLAQAYPHVVLSDIALRWLVIARKRAEEAGVAAQFVACCAEALPFEKNQFGVVVAASVLEHARDPDAFLAQTLRVLDKDGVCVLTTPNRWSIGPDSHLGLWGFGLLPKRAQRFLAGVVRGLPFEKIETRGYVAWSERLLAAGFRRVKFALPSAPDGLSGLSGLAAGVYERCKDWSAARAALLLVGPAFEIYAFKGPNRS
jgi:ubiquinone/menaquinone biosynthesis C-methylase UbiE/uncharacterized protein YbaR (Trm112 family)